MASQPTIVMSSLDADRLDKLIESLPGPSFPGKRALEAELERADVIDPADMPATVVTMNSEVLFKVDSSSEEFCLTLVYPDKVDNTGKTISILAPVGSALLGLSIGDEIEWPKPGGGMMKVLIADIRYQPERAGDYHR